MRLRGMMRGGIYGIELLMLYILQTTAVMPAVCGVRPLLLIGAAMSIALSEGEIPGLAVGIGAGLLMDLAGAEILGIHALILGVACYVLGSMTTELFKANLPVLLLAMAVVVPLNSMLEWLIFFVLPGYPGAVYALQTHYAPQMLYTFALTPLFYVLNRGIVRRFHRKI
ncbi:MAG: rod shape-determining protein MreD [Clostridia bacterium]|nr:rod shape-determining protein MreD [Clostridia bacterium]